MGDVPGDAREHERIEFGGKDEKDLIEMKKVAWRNRCQCRHRRRRCSRATDFFRRVCHCRIIALQGLVIVKGRGKGKDLDGELMVEFRFH